LTYSVHIRPDWARWSSLTIDTQSCLSCSPNSIDVFSHTPTPTPRSLKHSVPCRLCLNALLDLLSLSVVPHVHWTTIPFSHFQTLFVLHHHWPSFT
jgi:hypothetical protein